MRLALALVTLAVTAPALADPQHVLPGVRSTDAFATFDARANYTHLSFFGRKQPLKEVVFDLDAQFLSRIGIGGYFQVPFNTGLVSDFQQMGNVELGALYVLRLTDLTAYARLGFAHADGRPEGFVHVASDPTDVFAHDLDQTVVRGHVGGRFRMADIVVGGELGYDRQTGPTDFGDGPLPCVCGFVASGAFGYTRGKLGVGGGISGAYFADVPPRPLVGLLLTSDYSVGSVTSVFVQYGLNLVATVPDEYMPGEPGFSWSIGAGVRYVSRLGF